MNRAWDVVWTAAVRRAMGLVLHRHHHRGRRSAERGHLLEQLERRLALSVSVVPEGLALHITGDDANQAVVIYDAHRGLERSAVVSVDADGNGSFADAGDLNNVSFAEVATFDIRLAGGGDAVSFHLTDNYAGADKSILTDLGEGNNRFFFGASLTEQITAGSTLRIAVQAGGGSDVAQVGISHIRNSQVSVEMALGAGDDAADIFGHGDVLNSTFAVTTRLGTGNDRFTADLDLEDFDILGAASVTRFDVGGGAGDDHLSVIGVFGGRGALNQGLLEASLRGGGGADTIVTRLDTFNLDGGTFRISTTGGAGSDSEELMLKLDPVSRGGALDLALRGNRGADALNASVEDAAGTSTYGPAGNVLLHGGQGRRDSAVTAGDAPFALVAFEA